MAESNDPYDQPSVTQGSGEKRVDDGRITYGEPDMERRYASSRRQIAQTERAQAKAAQTQATISWGQGMLPPVYSPPPSAPSPDPYGRALGKSVEGIDFTPVSKNPPTGGGGGGGSGGGNRNPKDQTETPSSINVPQQSTDVLEMPNINKKVLDYTKRLQLQFIRETKEVLLGGVNFESINFISEERPQILLGIKRVNMIQANFNEIVQTIKNQLDKGNPELDSYNPSDFLKIFSVQYNDNGDAELTLSIDVSGWAIKDSIEVLRVSKVPRAGS